jgi:uncharacterized phage-associated protein
MKYAVKDANKIAKYMLSKQSMSQKKLHKLLYFAYAYYLYVYNNKVEIINHKLFENDFYAWTHGPVYKSLYPVYRIYGYNQIELVDRKEISLDAEVKEIVDLVLERFESFSADDLETMTHKEVSWISAREGLGTFEAGFNKLNDKLILQQMIDNFGNGKQE